MLSYDMNGRLIEPSRLKKTIGGDFDDFGIPNDIVISSDGVTQSDFAGDPEFAKVFTRTTPGVISINNNSKVLKGRHIALCVRAFIIGAGSSATSGQTRRNFRIGFRHSNNNDGLFLEYRSPDVASDGTFITAVNSGSTTRKPINYHVNNPGEYFVITFWISRNKKTGGWTATLCEGEQVRTVMEFSSSEVDLDEIWTQAFVEWDWTYGSGTCSPGVAKFEQTTYWQF